MADARRDLEFIYTPLFERSARGLLDDECLRHAELELLANPRAGAMVAGTGGIRKLRVAVPGRGKRGSARVASLYVEIRGRVYFLLAYAKAEQLDLSTADKQALRGLVHELEVHE